MSKEQATIDGQDVTVEPAETILDAARRLGLDVPTLCYTTGLRPEGGCRMCLVEVEGAVRPQAACHTSLQPGMAVHTETPHLRELRRDVLSLMLSAHEPDRFIARVDGNQVEALMAELELSASRFGQHGQPASIDQTHPYLRYDPSLCITCRQCLNACEQVQGQFVYGIAGRGPDTHLIYGPSPRFIDSDCTACGACVDRCPTGAISDRDRIVSLPTSPTASPTKNTTRSTCGYCGVGCQVRIEAANGRVQRIDGVPDATVNRGHLCAKGRYAHAYHHHPDRLTTPLLREGDQWTPLDWPDALDWLASRLGELHARHGGHALAAIASSRSTNEATYLLQKLFRTALGSNHVDCCARVCHASTALALQWVTGTGAASASFADIERARCIFLIGANPTEAHPVVGARIKEVALRGTPLVVIDPRRIELAEYADLHLPLRPGTNVLLFNALTKLLLEAGQHDRSYVDQRLEGFEALAEFLAGQSLAAAVEGTGVAERAMHQAARWLGEAGPMLFVHGLGLSEQSQGTESVMAMCNLAMLTGSVGRAGAGLLPLRGQNNVQGAVDMGCLPNQVTGYQPLDDPAVRSRFAAVWGAAPPTDPGRTVPEMLDAARRGELRGLWVQGADLAQSESDQTRTTEALQRLELLVVQDMFFCETARYAHLVLPAAGALEQMGTFTNGERRIQLVNPAVPPPSAARPDWEVIRDVAQGMGRDWAYRHPGQVMDEIARVAPKLFGGISYGRLGEDGLQWPCPNRDHPGSALVHADGFLRGKGRLTCVDYQPAPEQVSREYPFLLITGRVLQQYNVGTMSRRTPQQVLAPADMLEMHPSDAARLALADGQMLELASRWGTTRTPLHRSHRVEPGMLFLSFHHPETHANLLVGPHVDPHSKCPDYKVTAVRVRPAAC